MRKRRVGLLIVGVCAAGLCALIVGIGILFAVRFPDWERDGKPIAFASEAWTASTPDWSWESTRLRMVDDLIEHHLAIGMRRDEIVALIGEPDDTNYFQAYEMIYYLGMERNSAFPMDSEWLVIDLDDADVAQAIELVSD